MVTTEDVKNKLITGLNLEDILIDEIDDNDYLFTDGLGLDSIDAIELIIILDNEYGIKFDDMGKVKDIFKTVQTLTDYINVQIKK